MPLTPRLTVAVCTWNRAQLLSDCLDSLTAQSAGPEGPPMEILVVDDGSDDETGEVVRAKAAGAPVPIRYLPQPRSGLSAARNRAIENAAGEIVLFFDDDQLAPEGYAERLLARFDGAPTAAGAGGPYRDYGGGPRTCARCSLAAIDLPGQGLRRVERLLGGNMAIRKTAFERIGLFDPEISGRGDESEWFHRARELEFLQDPELWIWHRRDRTTLAKLLGDAIRQGRATPLARERMGRPARPRASRVLRGVAHAATRGCAMGLVRACREIGAFLGPRDLPGQATGARRGAA